MSHETFLSDIKTLRERARRRMREGSLTRDEKAGAKAVVKVLNEALATEIVCVLRYKRHQFAAKGIRRAAAEFAEHAAEEQAHADMIAQRIVQLGGEPDYSPAGVVLRSRAERAEGSDLIGMIEEDLAAERVAIESYAEIVRYLGDGDPTTRRMFEVILAKEREHAADLLTLLQGLGGRSREVPAAAARG
ncbi:MAG TPA: ferritin-like domain-containing protein [Elusimicrobiota bacterium]|jgi:bacterioferritin|nr:ferritin-like domain-containing protein [Elusimicrobiota bacterium]